MKKRILRMMLRPIKQFFAIVFIFVLTVPSCFAQDSKWIGIWNSNTINYDYKLSDNANQKVDVKINCEFFLFSDNYSFSKITFYFDMNAEGIKCTAETIMNCPGEWKDEGNLSVIPDDKKAKTIVSSMNTEMPDVFKGYRLSASDKQILEAQLNEELRPTLRTMINMNDFLDENGEFPIERLKQMGMKWEKTEVDKPFYYVEPEGKDITFINLVDDYDKELMHCCFYDLIAKQFNVGLFRRVYCEPCYYCTYSIDGGCVTYFDDGSLSRDKKEHEREWCNVYADSTLSPKSGFAKFKFTDGCVYEGEWAGKQPSGEGCKTLPDGSWMRGIWKEGVLHEGTGMIKQPKGKYEGDLKNGQIFGKGVLTLVDGSTYDGLWENGEFKTGTIKKKIDSRYGNTNLNGNADEYEYVGGFDNSSFAIGKCTYHDGSVFDGQWNNMKIQNGSITIYTDGSNYPVFEGVVANGKLDRGCFTSKAGYKVLSSFNEKAVSNGLTITFQNGDQCKGMWDAATGQLVPASVFEYIWSDGIKCSYTIDSKLRLKNPSYFNADGSPGKSSIAKKREMMNTDGEGYTIPVLNVKEIMTIFNRKTTLPVK